MSSWSPARQAYSTWTQERITTALTLRAQGKPSHEIGAELGISENAVIGKLWRIAEAADEARQEWDLRRQVNDE